MTRKSRRYEMPPCLLRIKIALPHVPDYLFRREFDTATITPPRIMEFDIWQEEIRVYGMGDYWLWVIPEELFPEDVREKKESRMQFVTRNQIREENILQLATRIRQVLDGIDIVSLTGVRWEDIGDQEKFSIMMAVILKGVVDL